jgi:hypothetical protein
VDAGGAVESCLAGSVSASLAKSNIGAALLIGSLPDFALWLVSEGQPATLVLLIMNVSRRPCVVGRGAVPFSLAAVPRRPGAHHDTETTGVGSGTGREALVKFYAALDAVTNHVVELVTPSKSGPMSSSR